MTNPSDLEQFILELINRARSDPAAEAARLGISLNEDLSPGTISSDPKDPLAFDLNLIDAARDHTAWMFSTNIFSHTGENGSRPSERMADAGYVFGGGSGSGENIAVIGSSTFMTASRREQNAAQLHENLFKSSGHRKNLMKVNFESIGLGEAVGLFEISGTTYNSSMVTQKFAYNATGPFLSGVIYTDADKSGLYSPGEGIGGVQVTAGGAASQSWSSGGYTLDVTSGPVTLSFGPGGAQSLTVEMDGNVKVDLVDGDRVETTGSVTLLAGLSDVTHLGLFGGHSVGTGAANRMIGGGGHDTFAGLSGDDVIEGLGGRDMLQGGAGDDTLRGQLGSDSLHGGDGDDMLAGGSSSDRLTGGDGHDELYGGSSADTLFGGYGGDTLWGQDGDDALAGDQGTDTLYGGDGDDRLEGGSSADDLYGGEGVDRIHGNGSADRLIGGGGGDFLYGGNGDDTVTGDEGADQLFGGGGADRIEGGAGADFLNGGGDNDDLFGGSGGDTLRGAAGRDSLLGEGGDDMLEGGTGFDTLNGGLGADRLTGGAGEDIFEFRDAAFGTDRIVDFEDGADRIRFAPAVASGFGALTITESNGDTEITVAGGTVIVEGVTGLTADDFLFA